MPKGEIIYEASTIKIVTDSQPEKQAAGVAQTVKEPGVANTF